MDDDEDDVEDEGMFEMSDSAAGDSAVLNGGDSCGIDGGLAHDNDSCSDKTVSVPTMGNYLEFYVI